MYFYSILCFCCNITLATMHTFNSSLEKLNNALQKKSLKNIIKDIKIKLTASLFGATHKES